jgi:hypothetical protein
MTERELGPNQELRAQRLSDEDIQAQVNRVDDIERATTRATTFGRVLVEEGMNPLDVAHALETAASNLRNFK